MIKVFSTAYWPNVQYMKELMESDSVIIDNTEKYQKQSYRNRTRILTANGIQDLIIPIVHDGEDLISRIRISYKEAWNKKHWRAICSAYGNSPYFDFLEPEFSEFYLNEYDRLFDYNRLQLDLLIKVFRIRTTVSSSGVATEEEIMDFRQLIHPKNKVSFNSEDYYQTFSDRFGFVPNLSVLDLLFNAGPRALNKKAR